MLKNIALAVAVALAIGLGILCIHFYGVAQRARDEAAMRRLLAEQEAARAQATIDFLGRGLVRADPAGDGAQLSSVLDRAGALNLVADPEVEAVIRAKLEGAAE